MMPDRDTESARREFDLPLLVGRLGAIYTKNGLSPPFGLRDAAAHWLGLGDNEIVDIIQKHFEDFRHLYTCGSGEQHFSLLRSAIGRAIEAKYPRAPVDEPARPRRRSSRVEMIPNAGGRPDVFVEGRAARLVRRSESNVERPAGLPGYEETGVPIGEDDDLGGGT